MKFIIKHEIPGRIRVHMVQPKMTFEEADILLYYLVNLENVTKAKVYERTQDAVIYYEKDRREIIKALQKFGYDRVTVPEGLTEHSGRQMNAEYQEKLLMRRFVRKNRSLSLFMAISWIYWNMPINRGFPSIF